MRGDWCVKIQDHVPRTWHCTGQTFCSVVFSSGDVLLCFCHVEICVIQHKTCAIPMSPTSWSFSWHFICPVARGSWCRTCSTKSFANSVVATESCWLVYKSASRKHRSKLYQRSRIDMHHRGVTFWFCRVPSSSTFSLSMPGFELKFGEFPDWYVHDNWNVLHDDVYYSGEKA